MQTDNKGFVFIEVIVISLLVVFSSLLIYKGFSKILIKEEHRKTYDNIEDVYKVNIISKLLLYNNEVASVDSNSCLLYFDTDCKSLFEELNVDRVLISPYNIIDTISYINTHPEVLISHTMNRYLNTIRGNNKSIVVSFKRNNSLYYASLELR